MSTEGASTPLEKVLSRLAGRSGFPALSSTISEINRIVAADTDSIHKLAQTILRDVSLTNKLLQVINSAAYTQFQGRIHTISKAVLILGFEAVRNVAMSLVMLEFTQGRVQEKAMHEEIVGAFFAGVVSKSLCEQLRLRSGEEGVICAMFQNLGRLLCLFFLYEESQQIAKAMAAGMTADEASKQVLGISYADLAVGIARHWNFPDRLIEGMRHIGDGDIKRPKTDVDQLRLVSNLATELHYTALHTRGKDKDAALCALVERYIDAIELNTNQLAKAIDDGLKEIRERARMINLAIADSHTLKTVKNWLGGPAEPASADNEAPAAGADPLLRDVNTLDALETSAGDARNPDRALADGVRDVTETLTTDFTLNDVLQMVLETMHRGMRFERTLIFIRDNKRNVMRARFGFGTNIEQVIQQCVFPLTAAADVFYVAMEKGVDIVIDDAYAANIASRIPQWHRQSLASKSFLLLPLVVKNKTIGLFYADSNQEKGVNISPEQLSLLRTLRSQAVIAFKQKM